ncbi:GNAT family N-acetyltransferase [Endozoicomonas ascidiicola]|uniref:GNAT family N-acetyltransferase n=1 Tax=Endozoicomonas ascidiicola TaxID=1698521 RepID=UPI000833756B|nr:GNAT family N-acetyltransferase [Endozoicomonas ascidiicola]
MKVINLKDCPWGIDTVARFHQEQWQALYPNWTLQEFMNDMELALLSDLVPQTWVLSDNKRLLGSVSLLECDLEGYEHYSPWLADVYVKGSHRGHGYGKWLIEAAMDFARSKKLLPLYLYTPDHQRYYEKMGWNIVEVVNYQGKQIVIMVFDGF